MAGGSGLTRGTVSLTHRSIEGLRPAEAPYRVSDQRCAGLAVRVAPTGIKTLLLRRVAVLNQSFELTDIGGREGERFSSAHRADSHVQSAVGIPPRTQLSGSVHYHRAFIDRVSTSGVVATSHRGWRRIRLSTSSDHAQRCRRRWKSRRYSE
jgi:hypothetical protein